jgi:biofilm protein TabA
VGLPSEGGRNLLPIMAIFGAFLTVRAQLAQDPRFHAAFAYLGEVFGPDAKVRDRISWVTMGATERHELSGGSFALEQAYRPKERPKGFFESHVEYIDIQVIIEGEELMEVEDISRLVVAEPYNPDRDFIKYADTKTASVLKMRVGDVAVFFPEDGHMPSLLWRDGGLVRKTVVKVPVK